MPMRPEMVWTENGETYSYFVPAPGTRSQNDDFEEYGRLGIEAQNIIEHEACGAAYWGPKQYLYASNGVKVADGLADWGRIAEHLGWVQMPNYSVEWTKITRDDAEFDAALIEAAKTLKLGEFSERE
ncbi:MAG: hypothetical protein ACTH1D_06810 [Mycobacteriaceae bacterium]|uniref:Uncharacterized protein n=1 Tax=Corynebacterium variabile (strain DSM 44702 / CIP 107183 / JCM 12073 / NCIMB 30131) TaxID=858619 RepID=G0HF33_CORVD|nr:hypothetical protein [Corynebacterium variabile]AEK37485.1 hypothetical protein CVAR_2135 [Corynebacterium variabile DSM 44702]